MNSRSSLRIINRPVPSRMPVLNCLKSEFRRAWYGCFGQGKKNLGRKRPPTAADYASPGVRIMWRARSFSRGRQELLSFRQYAGVQLWRYGILYWIERAKAAILSFDTSA